MTPSNEKPTIIVGGEIDYPPYSFLDENGEPTGLQIELVRVIAKIMGMDIEIRLRPWPETRKALEDGQIDIIPGMFYSEERAKIYDFSPPFCLVSSAIFARKNDQSIKSIEDLRNKEIIVMRGEAMHDYIIKHRLTKRLLLAETPADAIRMLAAGKGDYALVAQMPGLYWIKELNLSNIETVGPTLEPFKNCFAVKKGNTLLLSRFVEGLNICNNTGKFQRISEEWLGILEQNRVTSGLVIKYASLVLVPLILLLAVSLLWSWMLRSTVNQKTKELQESEDRFRSLVSNIPGVVYRCMNDSDWTMLFISREIVNISGYQASDFINNTVRSYASVIHPDDRNLVDYAVQKGVEGNETYSIEYRLCRADNCIRWVHDQGQGVFPSDGNLPWRDGVILDITDQKLAQEALRESEEKHRILLDEANEPISSVTKEGRYRYVNKAFAYSVCKRVDEIIGTTIWDVFPREEADKRFAALNHVCKTGEEQIIEALVPCPDRDRHYLTTIMPVFDSQGNTMTVICTSKDITDRKSAEMSIRDSEEKFSKAFDNAPLLMTISSIEEGTYLNVNKKFLEVSGFAREEAIGKTSVELGWVDPKDREVLIHDLRKKGSIDGVELELETKEKKKIICLYYGELITVAGQQRLLSIGQDITERKRAEDMIMNAAHEWSTSFDAMPDGVSIHDSDHTILRVNRSLCQLLGKDAEELIGKKCYDIFHGTDNPIVSCPIELSRKTGKKEQIEYYDSFLNKWLSVSSSPIFDESGQLKQLVHIVRDITNRKRKEEEKARLEAQLQHAQKIESIGRLAGGVAHDFNNMLSLIIGHAELAMEKVDPAHLLHDDLQEIRKAAKRSANLTRQLLAFARRQTIEPKVLDLNETVEGMLRMLQRLIGEDIDLRWQPEPSLWQVKVDPSQIDQILANLSINARDAISDVGKLTIETTNIAFDEEYCSTHPGFVPGEYVRLTVSDDGCGMDRETLLHIFEPFFTTKGIGEGTGLGLATVYGIIKQNNGFINVYSEPGKGTTFTIYLPRHMGKAEQKTPKDKQAPAMRGQETILLVEDEPDILSLTKRLLERQGYTVLAASTPGEAIRLAKEYVGEIDLLMTDVVMPEMNGRDLAKTLLDHYPHLRRLFTSGYTANVIAHHGVLDEGVHFIQKPFSIKSLATKLREVLDKETAK